MSTGLTYAIGDIHGCAGALRRLLAAIEAHRAGAPRRLVFLGDAIDRGPDSAGVVATLRALQAAEPDAVTCLLGNHESLMLAAYRDGFGTAPWLENGGVATLKSYGTRDPQALPHDVLNWMSALPTVSEDSRRYYVHAGFRPGRPGIDPDVPTRLWVREPFLSADYDFGRHVVHGHTPQTRGGPDCRRFRTNLDTGAVFGNALTAGVFSQAQGPALEFLRVSAG